jgi:hypothetical protein
VLRLYSIPHAIATNHAAHGSGVVFAQRWFFDAFGDCAIGDTARAEVRDRV